MKVEKKEGRKPMGRIVYLIYLYLHPPRDNDTFLPHFQPCIYIYLSFTFIFAASYPLSGISARIVHYTILHSKYRRLEI